MRRTRLPFNRHRGVIGEPSTVTNPPNIRGKIAVPRFESYHRDARNCCRRRGSGCPICCGPVQKPGKGFDPALHYAGRKTSPRFTLPVRRVRNQKNGLCAFSSATVVNGPWPGQINVSGWQGENLVAHLLFRQVPRLVAAPDGARRKSHRPRWPRAARPPASCRPRTSRRPPHGRGFRDRSRAIRRAERFRSACCAGPPARFWNCCAAALWEKLRGGRRARSRGRNASA